MPQYRIDRISDEIRRVIDRIIREELNDPRISGTFSITRVEATRDLRYAKVYVSVLEADKLENMMKALKGAAGYLRRAMGEALALRYTPELQFVADKNIEYGVHIADVLKKVMADQEQADDEA